jgi:hypothetical protein
MNNNTNVVYMKNFVPLDLQIPDEWTLQFYDPVENPINLFEASFQAYKDELGNDRGNLEVYWAPEVLNVEGDEGEYVFVMKDSDANLRSAYKADENFNLVEIPLPRK